MGAEQSFPSIAPSTEKGSSKMLLTKQDIKAIDKKAVCSICNKLLKSSSISCSFDLIKCPEHSEHIFHWKCFNPIDHPTYKCPVCSCDCKVSVCAFVDCMCYALLKKEDLLPIFSNLSCWLHDFDHQGVIFLLSDVDFTYQEIKQIIKNLEPYRKKNEQIAKFCNVLTDFSKKREIFEFERKDLYEAIISKRYDGDLDAYYPILFRCSFSLVQQLDYSQLFELIKSYSFYNTELDSDNRLVFCAMILMEMKNLDKFFPIEYVYDIIMAIIQTKFSVNILKLIKPNELNENINVEMIVKLLITAYNSELNLKDTEKLFGQLFDCIKFTEQDSVELIERLIDILGNSIHLSRFLSFLRIDEKIKFGFPSIKKIFDFCIQKPVTGDVFLTTIAYSIFSLEAEKFEELLAESMETKRIDIIENVLLGWPKSIPLDKAGILQILENPVIAEENISTVVFPLILNKFIGVSLFFDLIEHFKGSVEKQLSIIGAFNNVISRQFTTKDYEKLLNICRKLNSIEYLICFLPFLDESQINELLSEEEQNLDFRKLLTIRYCADKVNPVGNLVDSCIFFRDFKSSILRLVDLMNPTSFRPFFQRLLQSNYYNEDNYNKSYYIQIITDAAVSCRNRVPFIEALLYNVSRGMGAVLVHSLVDFLLICQVEPRDTEEKSELDKILEEFTKDTFKEATRKNFYDLVERFLLIDIKELTERFTETYDTLRKTTRENEQN